LSSQGASVNDRLTITEVADKIGVTTKTLIRWEKAGKINKPKRDWKGWRIYLQEDLEALERLVNGVYEI
jgi:DNA-binding transcriptional MerR regulator